MRRRLGIWCLRPWIIPILEDGARQVQEEKDPTTRGAGYAMGKLSTCRKILTLSKWDDCLTTWRMPPRGVR